MGDGVIVGSATGRRTMKPTTSRRRCPCGQRETHVGLGDGVALTSGCEWCVRLWVRDPFAPRPTRAALNPGGGDG